MQCLCLIPIPQVIHRASPSVDSGNYTCRPAIGREASIKVHVLESECEVYFFIRFYVLNITNISAFCAKKDLLNNASK